MAAASLFLPTSMVIIFIICNIPTAITLPNFQAIFIFGDSTVDTGNNKYIKTAFRTDHPPYGQDFPGHIATGRCSNGKLIPDFMGNFLGIKETVPPFLDPNLSNEDLRTGVCFASAGSGYDYVTTAVSGVIPMSKQLELFKNYITRLKGIFGEEETNKIIGSAFIIVSAGTNDFVYNFYDSPTRSLHFNISSYQDFVLNILRDFVKELYNLGGRSMVIGGIPPIGCLPIQITERLSTDTMERKCLEDQNSDSQSYNIKLRKLLNELQASVPDSRIVYANVYDPLMDMISHPQKYGLVETNRGCCGTGLIEAAYMCNTATPTCGMANQFLFWDSIHPTQAAYKSLTDYLVNDLLHHFISSTS